MRLASLTRSDQRRGMHLAIHEAADDGDYSAANHRVQSDADRGTG